MILIDRLIGLPIVFCLNGLARLLGLFLSRDHSICQNNVRTIVISKFVGMGSIIQAGPFIVMLKKKFPAATIILLTQKSNSSLIGRIPAVDGQIYVDTATPVKLVMSMMVMAVRLWRLRVDLFFDLELYSTFASVIALISMARNRFGFYRQSANFKKGIFTHLLYFNTRMPIRHIYEQLGGAAGCLVTKSSRLPPLQVFADDLEEAETVIARHTSGNDGDYVVINTNASDLMLERRWPLENFAALIEKIASRTQPVFLVGAPTERGQIEEVQNLLSPTTRENCFNLAGELSLGGFLALLVGAKTFITNDTGPMHMAFALGVPTVCLFGPGSPDHYTIQSEKTITLRAPVYCSPCLYEIDSPPCGGDNICMRLILPDEVEKAFNQLARGDFLPSPSGAEEVIYECAGKPLGLLVRESVSL